MQLLEHEMVIVSSDIIDTKNSLDRYKAVISVDTEKLNELVKVSTQNKARQRLSQCDAVICMISAYDVNVSWIDCTFCQAWVHQICDCLTAVECKNMEDSQLPYKCLKCNGKEKHDIPDCLQQNQKKLELTLQEYKHDKMLLQSQYDSKYHAIIDTMGKREK